MKSKSREGTKTKKMKKSSLPRRLKATPFKVVDVEKKHHQVKELTVSSENYADKEAGDIKVDEATFASSLSISPKQKKKKKFKEKKTASVVKPMIDLSVKGEDDDGFLDASHHNDAESGGEEAEEGNYENFMEALASLDGKKRITGSRTEGTGELSEYNLSAHRSSKVEVGSLLAALGDEDSETRELERRLGGGAGLTVPLEPFQADRVVRQAGYSAVRRDVSQWDAVVHSRRAADTVTFPLNKPDLKLKSISEDRERFKPETPLEQQVAAVLAGSRAVVREGEQFSEIEKKGLAGMTVREAMERKAELGKIRALQTYQEAKFRRQGKIKSKKYRKIERKLRNKEKLAELEELSKTDPEAAAEKLAELDKARIEERATLKHRNASKHLQEQAKRAKTTKNKDHMNSVQDQLRQHRELLTKHGEKFDDTIEDPKDEEKSVAVNSNCEILKKDETFAEFDAGYRKFWEEDQARKKAEAQSEVGNDLDDMFEDASHEVQQINMKTIDQMKLSLQRSKPENIELEEAENPDELIPTDSLHLKQKKDSDLEKLNNELNKKIDKQTTETPLPNVDPDNFMNIEPKILSAERPELIGYNEEDEEDQRDIIAEAFAEDDVVEAFKAEKSALIESKKPKSIDLTLPGWGEWGGGGAAPSKRKRKRFTIKAPPVAKRRDENTGNLILNTDKDTKLRQHQVSSIPFPFTAVSDFEASIRAPVGSTFIPRTAHLKMVKPRVKTLAGHVIQPMDRQQLLKRGIGKSAIAVVGGNNDL